MPEPESRVLVEQSCVAVRVGRPMAGIDVGMLAGEHYGTVARRAAELGLQMTGAPYVRYHAWGGETAVVELGFPIVGEGAGQLASLDDVGDGEPGRSALPGGPAVVVEHRGPYAGLAGAWERFGAWIEEQGLSRSGAPWESYVDNPDSVPSDQLRTELICPLEGKA